MMAVNINGNSNNGIIIRPNAVEFAPSFIDESDFEGGTHEDTVLYDSNVTAYYDAVVTTGGKIEITNVRPVGLQITNITAVTPTIATVAYANGAWQITRVGTGTAKFNVLAGGMTRQLSISVSSAVSATHYTYNSFVDGCLSKHCNDAIEGMAAAVTQANWNAGIKTGRLLLAQPPFHQPYDPDYPVFQAQWNPNCWAASVDFSGCACYASGGMWNGPLPGNNMGVSATAISPRHVIGCGHYHPTLNSRLYFLGSDGNMVMRTVVGLPTQLDAMRMSINGISLDLHIALLDADLPETVSHYKVLPDQTILATYIPTVNTIGISRTTYCCGLHRNRFQQIGIGPVFPYMIQNWAATPDIYLGDVQAAYDAYYDLRESQGSPQTPPCNNAIREYYGVGDSGTPNFALVNGLLVLGGIVSSSYANLTARHDAINAEMTALSNAAGLSAGETAIGHAYQLDIADLSAFPTY